jgi:oligosaccharide repeat unit polymerase
MSPESFLLRALRILPILWVIFICSVELDVQLLTRCSLAIIALLFILYRFDLTNVWVAFSMPWFLILIFGTLGISEYSRDVDPQTIAVVVSLIAIGAALIPPVRLRVAAPGSDNAVAQPQRFRFMLVLLLSIGVLNVVAAGYVPIVRLATTGDSGYMTFGIKGVYGFFNAFANALGITAFYLWMTERQPLYRNAFFTVLAVFLLFMTRQNIISLLVESFVVFNLVRRRIPLLKIAVIVVVVLFFFGVIGDLRVGKAISKLAKITDEYMWIPTAGIWLYAYFYFNLLNLDNAINAGPPFYDFRSFSQLVPSFLRPAIEDGGASTLEVSQFTVGSFISPIYRDVGMVGLCLLFAVFCFGLEAYRRRIKGQLSYVAITSYSVLYFCFMFSFFENFFFYLPVIFQLFFLFILRKYLFVQGQQDAGGGR